MRVLVAGWAPDHDPVRGGRRPSGHRAHRSRREQPGRGPVPRRHPLPWPRDWSADSRRIALEGFDPNDAARPEVGMYVAGADGSGMRQVTSSTDGRPHVWPSLSPDGRRLAFLAQDPDKPLIGIAAGDLFVVGVSTGPASDRSIPRAPRSCSTGTSGRPVDWSPDGRQILFAAVDESLDANRAERRVPDRRRRRRGHAKFRARIVARQRGVVAGWQLAPLRRDRLADALRHGSRGRTAARLAA